MSSARGISIEIFEYPDGPAPAQPCWDGILPSAARNGPLRTEAGAQPAPLLLEDQERAAAEEQRRSFEAGRQQGFEMGRKAEREALAVANQKRAAQAVVWLSQFDQERQRYMAAVEYEVVELALGIAARVLRREAQMDPLLLTGAVRVALGQLSASTQARLRVPAADLGLWAETMEHLPNLALKPTLEAVPQMHAGDCTLETELGSVDLGIRAQLTEIERGFFDKAATPKPAEESAPALEGGARGAKP